MYGFILAALWAFLITLWIYLVEKINKKEEEEENEDIDEEE